MPPPLPLIEVTETKTWASLTVDSLFTDREPITFEPWPTTTTTTTTTYSQPPNPPNPPPRRSTSLFESNQFLNSATTTTATRSNTHRSASHSSYTLFSISDSDSSIPDLDTSSTRSSSPISSPVFSPISSRRSLSSRLSPIDSKSGKQQSLSFKEREGLMMWRRTFEEYLLTPFQTRLHLPPSSRSAQLTRFITTELLTTEITYLDHLKIIKQSFMDPLINAANDTRRLVNLRDIQPIFAFVPQLIMLSTSLVHSLRDTMESEIERVGSVFSSLENDFQVYIFYAVNFPKLQKCLYKADRNTLYRQLAHESLRNKETNRMGLSDYMIAPIQRITRYCLLLKDLKKHSISTQPDFEHLQRALHCMTSLALAMNNIQKK
ncbi:Dbl homology domain-containing protein [Phycomyces nitens]|nr:Dbl homology domain-containing protein [Phycomyces nitens]